MSSYAPLKKSQETNGENGGDRISNLPDSIISGILSRVPTKDTVRSSILSKDWEYKWTSIYNIDINDEVVVTGKMIGRTSFVEFVDRLLLLIVNVVSFHLKCQNKYDPNRVRTWKSAILRRNVRSLKVQYCYPGVTLPPNLLNNHFLENLDLLLPCIFKVLGLFFFGSLRTLDLDGVEILNELSNSNTVVFEFPVLHTLHITRCKWLNVKCVEIIAPKMTSFVSGTRNDEVSDYLIKITTDYLITFRCYGGLPENIVLCGGPEVTCIFLENGIGIDDARVLRKTGLQVRKLLKELSSLIQLRLSYHVAKSIGLSRSILPNFINLEKLVVSGSAEILIELLDAAPSLKRVVIDGPGWGDYDYDAMEHVPLCVELCLEAVKFKGFSWR